MNQDSKPTLANVSPGKPSDFSWALFFSEVFVPRKSNAIEEYLSWGFPDRVPSLEAVKTDMPRPWLFARLLLFSLLGTAILWYTMRYFENEMFIPAFIAFGCFAIPCSVMILFYETNIFRDVSIVRVIGSFLAGSIMSLCLVMPLYSLVKHFGFSAWLGASVAGPVEEMTKLCVAVFLLRFVTRKSVFSGLLVGAAVGAGFASFESAGYALQFGPENIILRGVLSPFTHVVWTALTTAALCHATGGRRLTWDACKDARFLGVFALVVGLHMVWNSPVSIGNDLIKYGILGLIAWTAVTAMLNKGLRQARAMKLALAAGDMGIMAGGARVDAEAPLWYSRAGEVHGPLAIAEIGELVAAGILQRSALVSEGSKWHPFFWWIGEEPAAADSSHEPSEIWAWALVWWPIVILALAYFFQSQWFLIGFPLVLVVLALIDRSANKRGKDRSWPTSLAALLPPIYLFQRRRCMSEPLIKLAAGSVVTGLSLAFFLFVLWQMYGTDEGKVVSLVNKQLSIRNANIECIEAHFERKISSNVRIYSAKLSNDERRTVTLLTSAAGLTVTVEGL